MKRPGALRYRASGRGGGLGLFSQRNPDACSRLGRSTGTSFFLSITLFASSLAFAEQASECLPDCLCPTPKLLSSRELPIKIDQSLLQRQSEALRRVSLENVEYSALGPVKEVWGEIGLVIRLRR